MTQQDGFPCRPEDRQRDRQAGQTDRQTGRSETQVRQTDSTNHSVKTELLPGTSGNLRSFRSSMLVAKMKREEPVTMAMPVPYGEWNTLASNT